MIEAGPPSALANPLTRVRYRIIVSSAKFPDNQEFSFQSEDVKSIQRVFGERGGATTPTFIQLQLHCTTWRISLCTSENFVPFLVLGKGSQEI